MPPLFQSIAPRDLSSPFVSKKKTLDFSKESREGSSEQVFFGFFSGGKSLILLDTLRNRKMLGNNHDLKRT